MKKKLVSIAVAAATVAMTTGAAFVPLVAGAATTVSGFVWDDLNHNGEQDSGEPGIAGVTIAVCQPYTTCTTTTTSLADGTYSVVSSYTSGTVIVRMETPAGYNATVPGDEGDANAAYNNDVYNELDGYPGYVFSNGFPASFSAIDIDAGFYNPSAPSPTPTPTPSPTPSPTPTPPPGIELCGDYISRWNTLGTAGGTNALKVNDAGDTLYVTENDSSGNYVVQKYDLSGNPTGTLLAHHNGRGLDLDSQGNIWVSDTQVVRGISPTGTPVGETPLTSQTFVHLAIDSQDNIWVGSITGFPHKVWKYNSSQVDTGVRIAYAGLNFRGVAVDSSDNVYVATFDKVSKHNPADGSMISQWTVPYDVGSGIVSIYIEGDNLYVVTQVQDGAVLRAKVGKFDFDGNLEDEFTTGSLPGESVFNYIAVAPSGAVYGLQWQGPQHIAEYGCATTPPLDQCVLDALEAMGVEPGTYPEMEEALGATCDDDPGTDDELTIVDEDVKNSYKLTCPESLVMAEGTEIGQNSIGSNDCSNQLFLGNGAIVNGNVLKTEDVWIAGTGVAITGNINHSVSLHVAPGAHLTVGGSINDLQLLEIGAGATVYVGQNLDVWVDIINEGTLEVNHNFDCNGLTAPPTNSGDITAGNDNCPFISVAIARNFEMGTWTYALLAAVLGFGFALILEERGSRKKK